MERESIPAFIDTVSKDRTVSVPEHIPPGTRVAIIILDAQPEPATDAARSARFGSTKAAIRAAVDHPRTPDLDDATLDELIRTARRS